MSIVNFVKSWINNEFLKRTKEQIYFKQQIEILLNKVLVEIDYLDKYNSLRNPIKYQINLFLAFYLTILFRRTLCGQ
jgi:hypothetical protein